MLKWCVFFLIFSLNLTTTLRADHHYTLGVVAYLDKAQMQLRYQPLVDHLNQMVNGVDVQLQILTLQEANIALSQRRLDFLVTDPSHYLMVRHRDSLSSALASLIRTQNGQSSSYFGGVIVTRATSHVRVLTDLQGVIIAAADKAFLGGYQAQILELSQSGLELAEPQLKPYVYQDDVIKAVLAGEVDVGFIRTGVLELLVQQGKLDLTQLRIINPQHLADFPFSISTKLYPEWPFVALSHVDVNVVRQIASALLTFPVEHSMTLTSGIEGFVPAPDYFAVEILARQMRLPPYENEAIIDWWEIIHAYRYYLFIFAVGFGLTLVLLWQLFQKNRQLAIALQQKKRAQQQLQSSHNKLDQLLATNPSVIYSLDPNTLRPLFVSANSEVLFGVSADKILSWSGWWIDSLHPEDRDEVLRQFRDWISADTREPLTHSYRMRRYHAEQHTSMWVWVEDQIVAVKNAAGEIIELIGSHTNIDARKGSEAQLLLAASVFENAREGILITSVDSMILDVNQAFTRITGYTRDEVMGQNPRLLNSGRQSKAFYMDMWQTLLERGFWEGEIWNRRKGGEIFAQSLTIAAVYNDQGAVSHYISLFADITQQKDNEQKLEHIAYYDALTGLPNRVLFTSLLHDAIVRADQTKLKFVLAFLDLDGFKEVNDQFGHAVGDKLLIEVAKRMQQHLRPRDVVARFGGDEFVILLDHTDDLEQQKWVLQSILDQIALPFQLQQARMSVSGSIGVTLYPQLKDVAADLLIRQADQAMYQAKVAGRNRQEWFDFQQESMLIVHHKHIDDMYHALTMGQFELYYQPKVNMRTGQVLGFEALIRWNHPEKGLLSPALFLPQIDRHPIEIDLGQWVIETALKQLSNWLDAGLRYKVSVNIAGHHLQDATFLPSLQALLTQYVHVSTTLLELEILETSAIEDMHTVSSVIATCNAMGISVALDDFGTGYSTLSHLKNLKVDTLKIDQSFVRGMLDDPDDLAILQGVIGFANAFHCDVIAEGVETEAHADKLIALGCDWGQGFSIARPMPAEQISQWIENWNNHAN